MTAGFAATVIVTDKVFVASAKEVAVMVTVCAEAVAAGAVKVAEVVVVFDRVPPPLTDQLTPAAFLSFVTAAVRVTESVPSTDVADGVMAMLIEAAEPPHPDKPSPATKNKLAIAKPFRTIQPSRL